MLFAESWRHKLGHTSLAHYHPSACTSSQGSLMPHVWTEFDSYCSTLLEEYDMVWLYSFVTHNVHSWHERLYIVERYIQSVLLWVTSTWHKTYKHTLTNLKDCQPSTNTLRRVQLGHWYTSNHTEHCYYQQIPVVAISIEELELIRSIKNVNCQHTNYLNQE